MPLTVIDQLHPTAAIAPGEKRSVRIIGLFVRFLDTAARRHWWRVRMSPDYWRVIAGDCLAPYFVEGDAVLIDFDRQPADGDVVCALMAYERRSFTMIGGGAPKVRRHEAIKQLRIVNGERYLCAADGSVSADPHEILGVVVAWYRPGWWRRPPLRRMQFQVPSGSSARRAGSK